MENLKGEHRQLLTQVEDLERSLAEITYPLSPPAHARLRELLEQFIGSLQSHLQREAAEVFPSLRRRLPEADHWLVRMIEVQYEMLLSEAQHLYGLVSGAPSSESVQRIKEGVAHLVRWLREHVVMEEERLFPKLEESP